jgi:hypothetical protein
MAYGAAGPTHRDATTPPNQLKPPSDFGTFDGWLKQKALAAMGYYRGEQSGIWGPLSKAAHASGKRWWKKPSTGFSSKPYASYETFLFQVALASMGYYRDKLDGIPGPNTRKGIRAVNKWWHERIKPLTRTSGSLRANIVRIAKGEVGKREIGGNNRGPHVDKYETASWVGPHDVEPWCASFVCWVVREALEGFDTPEGFTRPTTPGAWDFERWAWDERNHGVLLFKPPQSFTPGDIVVFKKSHIGIVDFTSNKERYVHTIEGNTGASGSRDGDGVYTKVRSSDSFRSVIRLASRWFPPA